MSFPVSWVDKYLETRVQVSWEKLGHRGSWEELGPQRSLEGGLTLTFFIINFLIF